MVFLIPQDASASSQSVSLESDRYVQQVWAGRDKVGLQDCGTETHTQDMSAAWPQSHGWTCCKHVNSVSITLIASMPAVWWGGTLKREGPCLLRPSDSRAADSTDRGLCGGLLCSDWSSSDISYLSLVERFKVAIQVNLGPHMRYENISQLCQPLLGNQNENKNWISTFISHKIW